MAQWQLGAAINFDAIQSIKAIWGGVNNVVNLFSKNDIQIAAVAYMANCSVLAGESTGWTNSLRTYLAIRSSNGFDYGPLSVGYPARHILPALLSSDFGPRWLGILATASFIRKEHLAENEIHVLLSKLANERTSQYILDSEQCNKIWLMGREIFLDSPMHHEYLRICGHFVEGNQPLSSHGAYVATPGYFSALMLNALRLWEMANVSGNMGRRLISRGFQAFPILVFYLTVICGFGVTVRKGESRFEFGSTMSDTHVTVVVDQSFQRQGWESGYLSEDLSLKDSVLHLMIQPKESEWQAGRASFTTAKPVLNVLSVSSELADTAGEANLFAARTILYKVKAGARPYVSHWLANILHFLVFEVPVGTKTYASSGRRIDTYNPTRRSAMAQRLRSGILLFAPEVFEPKDIERLIHNVQEGKKWKRVGTLEDALPETTANLICGRPCHGGREETEAQIRLYKRDVSQPDFLTDQKPKIPKDTNSETKTSGKYSISLEQTDLFSEDESDESSDYSIGDVPECSIQSLQIFLHQLVRKLWLCAFLEPKSQHFLRNIGPDIDFGLDLPQFRKIFQAIDSESELQSNVWPIATHRLVQAITEFAAGRALEAPTEDVLALSAGGAIVGLNTNDNNSIEADPGHCLYIVSGSMEVPWRRIREASERHKSLGIYNSQLTAACRSLAATLTPEDAFGEGRVEHLINVEGSKALVTTSLYLGNDEIHFHNLRTIDQTTELKTHRQCFKKCVKGRLTPEETERVFIITLQSLRNMDLRREELRLVLAHRNTTVQRAMLSLSSYSTTTMLSLGQCVHCACKAALINESTLLLV
ncbi:hypothetical protein MMC10_006451 [Thelotrema lepadinum]|nr:hypothetical protein [Thelotrema lepadinum]